MGEDVVSHDLEKRFALMTDGTSLGVNVALAIVEARALSLRTKTIERLVSFLVLFLRGCAAFSQDHVPDYVPLTILSIPKQYDTLLGNRKHLNCSKRVILLS